MEKKARLNIPIDKEIKRLAKIAALEQKMSLQDFVVLAISEKISITNNDHTNK